MVGRADSSDNEEKDLSRASHVSEYRLISTQLRRFPKAGPIIIGKKERRN